MEAARREAAAGRPAELHLGVDSIWARLPGGLSLVVLHEPARGGRVAAAMRWGLRLGGAEDESPVLYRPAEAVAGPGPLREAARRRRLIIPVDGYVQRASRSALAGRRFAVRRADGAPMAVAGVWSMEEEHGPAFCVLICPANPALSVIHDRMPLVLDPSVWPVWLGDRPLLAGELAELLRPCRPEAVAIAPAPRQRSRRPSSAESFGEQMRLLGLDAEAISAGGSVDEFPHVSLRLEDRPGARASRRQRTAAAENCRHAPE